MFRLSGKGPGGNPPGANADISQDSHGASVGASVGDSAGDAVTASTIAAPEIAPPLKPFSKKGTHMPTKPTTPSNPQNFRNEIPRRVLDIPGAQRKLLQGEEAIDTSGENKLVVGKEISLSGAISSCECLVVEGEVAADLPEAKTILVSRGGVFRGTAQVEKAEISGLFEGDLTVTDVAVIKPGGVIKGSVSYVSLVMEKGGVVDGKLTPMKRQGPPIQAKIAEPEPTDEDSAE